MEKIKIEDIASELGVKNTEVLNKAVGLSIKAKSYNSGVSIEDAQKIFDAIIHNKKHKELTVDTLFHSGHNLNIYVSEDNIDYNYLNRMVLPYKNNNIENFLIFSFNFSDKVALEIYSIVLDGLNIEKYLKETLSKIEFEKINTTVKTFSNDVDISYIDDNNPLEDITKHIQQNKPQMIYIEGIELKSLNAQLNIFNTISKFTKLGIKFELGFVNADKESLQLLNEMIIK